MIHAKERDGVMSAGTKNHWQESRTHQAKDALQPRISLRETEQEKSRFPLLESLIEFLHAHSRPIALISWNEKLYCESVWNEKNNNKKRIKTFPAVHRLHNVDESVTILAVMSFSAHVKEG